MPSYGPWIDPGEMWVTTDVHGIHQNDHGPVEPTGTQASDAPAPQSTTDSPPNALVAGATALGAPAWEYDQATARIAFNLSDLIYEPPSLMWPAGVIGVDIEAPALGVFIGPTTAHLGATSTASGPGTDMTATNWWVYDADGWTPSSSLIGMSFRSSGTFTDTDIPCDLTSSDYAITGTGDQHFQHSLLVVADRQVTGANLASPGGTNTDRAQVDLDPIRVTVFCHPPRYRFIYSYRPPLAHRQRADGTATAGPQLAHIGTAGGRPPLAWRQNTTP